MLQVTCNGMYLRGISWLPDSLSSFGGQSSQHCDRFDSIHTKGTQVVANKNSADWTRMPFGQKVVLISIQAQYDYFTNPHDCMPIMRLIV